MTEEYEAGIREQITSIPSEMLRRTVQNVTKGLQEYLGS